MSLLPRPALTDLAGFGGQHRVPGLACKQSLTIKVFENFNEFPLGHHCEPAPRLNHSAHLT
jgi:hypothetical protein